jgi:hypothetical protein
LLAHRDLRNTTKYYNRARGIEADAVEEAAEIAARNSTGGGAAPGNYRPSCQVTR